MSDTTYQTKVYLKQGGEELVVADGGKIRLEGTGKIVSADDSEIASTKNYQVKQVADLSAEATYYLTARYAGKITSIKTIIDGAVGTADVTITPSINGTPVTNGVVTIATSGSAAGDQDSATPSAANTVAIGDKISFVVTGGGSGGSPRGEVVFEITAQ
jgi:hypothetical protein